MRRASRIVAACGCARRNRRPSASRSVRSAARAASGAASGDRLKAERARRETRDRLGDAQELGTLAQVLELGEARAGRELSRPSDGCVAPPSGRDHGLLKAVVARRRVMAVHQAMPSIRETRADRSGREALAATRATGGDDLAAADGRHAGAETVATLAHDLAGLISPLHGSSPVSVGSRGLFGPGGSKLIEVCAGSNLRPLGQNGRARNIGRRRRMPNSLRPYSGKALAKSNGEKGPRRLFHARAARGEARRGP